MAQPAFERDNILSAEERAVSARKCVKLLSEVGPEKFNSKAWAFFCDQRELSQGPYYQPTERQLAWLRDLVSKLAA